MANVNAGEMLGGALEAVGQAMVVCRHVQGELGKLRAITKDDRSPVTIADFASQAVVGAILREHFGGANGGLVMVGEESSGFLRDAVHAAHLRAAIDAVRDTGVWPGVTESELLDAIDVGAQEPNAKGFWTLDPIDGTKGFLRNEQYCVSLAYIERGTVLLGVLGCPNLGVKLEERSATGTVYSAVCGDGATMHFELGGQGAAEVEVHLERGDIEEGEEACLAESVESGHTRHEVSAAIMRSAGPLRESIRIDSQCKYAVVARGDADVYLRVPTKREYSERIWDHAAGVVIAEEAGCRVTDLRGEPLDFSCGKGLDKNFGVLGAPPRLHGRLVKGIEGLGAARNSK